MNKAKTWVLLREYDKAMECYSKALSINPNPIKKELWHEIGIIYYKVKKYEKAVECFTEAIKIDPSVALFWYNKGYALASLGNEKQAATCFDRAIEMDSNLH